MNLPATLKIIGRSWWRNKVFFFISLISLAIGLTCTILLFTYLVHEYNIESNTRDKERIFFLRQDDPMTEGKKVAFASADIPLMLKEKYAEVEDFLRMNAMPTSTFTYGEEIYKDICFIQADSTLCNFFDYITVIGDLNEVLQQPDKIAVSEKLAKQIFGNRNPLGEVLELKDQNSRKKYKVTAILKERPQSLLQFDILAGTDDNFWGGVTFIKLKPNVLPDLFAEKINKDKIPTLTSGKYYLDNLSDIYFSTPDDSTQQPLSYIHQCNVQLLLISLIAALLVLIIASFNYTNMNLSRILQQLKMIQVEKLMGSTEKEIRYQLFGDAFLTVLIAFGLSLLIINDCLSMFNTLLASNFNIRFFFSSQMLPLLFLLVLIIAILPAWYISRKLSCLSLSEYKLFSTGRRKKVLITVLVILQFAISIGLIHASLIANGQMKLIKEKALCYENCIEIGDIFSKPTAPLKAELIKQVSGIESVSVSLGSLLNSWIRELTIKQPGGTEKKSHLLMITSDTDFLNTMRLQLISGNDPVDLQEQYAYPVIVNESFVRNLVPAGINPIGHYLHEMDALADTLSIIGGIVKDFAFNSLEDEIVPAVIFCPKPELMKNANFIQIRLKPENKKETLQQIANVWNQMNEGEEFKYTDMYQLFMKRNNKVFSLSRVLIGYSLIGLLLTCLGLFGISWYATRQRLFEISIRKIHGATPWQIFKLLNRPFYIQMLIAYILAIPTTYWLMLIWREQFVYQSALTVSDFLLPLLIVWFIATLAVCVQGYILNKANPIQSIKSE